MAELKPPILTHPLTRDNWESFVVHAEAYMQRGGTIPIRNLIGAKILPLLKLRLKGKVEWDKIGNTELIKLIYLHLFECLLLSAIL